MFTPIRDILKTSLRQPGVAKQARANRVAHVFRTLVNNRLGQAFVDRIAHISYVQSMLIVSAQHPLVVQELRLYTPYWIQELDKECGNGVVKAIRFVVGSS